MQFRSNRLTFLTWVLGILAFPALLLVGMFMDERPASFDAATVMFGILYAYAGMKILSANTKRHECSLLFTGLYTLVLAMFPLSIILNDLLSVYERFEAYDIVMHTLGGAFVALVFEKVKRKSDKRNQHIDLGDLFWVLGIVLFAGITWELYELCMGAIGTVGDTVSDIFCDLTGGWLLWVVYSLENLNIKCRPA